MAGTYENIRLENTSGTVLMYFPITTTVEEIWQNDIKAAPRPWNKGGAVAVDVKLYTAEIVLQGVFVSSDAPVDATYLTALRTVTGIAAPTAITAMDQYNWLLEKILTTDQFKFHYNGNVYGYASGSVDISAGQFPYVAIKELRTVGETNDRVSFTLRMIICQPNLPRS